MPRAEAIKLNCPDAVAPTSRDDRPLIDRERAVAEAERALGELEQGRSHTLAVSGEPGIGKTRFACELTTLAEARAIATVWARDIAVSPCATLRESIDQLDGRPLALVVDDVHRANGSWLAAVADLISRPAQSPILVVLVCARGLWPAGLLDAMQDADRRGAVTDLKLGRLSREGIDRLLGAELEGDLLGPIHVESGGNPRFALELARAAGRDAVPATLVAMIAEEVASLSPDARAVLRAGAVIGNTFDAELAAAVVEVGQQAASDAIDELAVRGLVRRASTGSCQFARPVVRSAVYEEMGLAMRMAVHERTARELATRRGPLAARAHHVEHGTGSGSEAVDLLLEAAGSSVWSRPTAASRWFAAALRKMDEGDGRRGAALMQASTAFVSAGRVSEGRKAFEEGASALVKDGSLSSQALVCAARTEGMLGLSGRTRALLQHVLASPSDLPSAAALRIALGIDHWRNREGADVYRQGSLALDCARASGRRDLCVHARCLLALESYTKGATTTAVHHLEEAERGVRRLSDHELSGALQCLLALGYVSHGLERYVAAADHFRRGVRVARAADNRFFVAALSAGATATLAAVGKLREAGANAAAAHDAAAPVGSSQLDMWRYTVEAVLSATRGDTHAALDAAERASHAADHLPMDLFATGSQCAIGAIRIDAGAALTGREQILRHAGGPTLERLEVTRRPAVYAALSASAIELLELDAAQDWAARAEASADAVGLLGLWATARSAHARLMLARGDSAAAVSVADEAAEAFADVGRAVDAGRTLALAGRARVLSGDKPGAVSAFRRAHTLLAVCEADRRRDLVARDLRRLGGTVTRLGRAARPAHPDSQAVGFASLSRREREVAELVAQGLTNRRIAEELFVSARTVEDHLKRTFAKLGVSSRAAVAAALEAA